MQCNHFRKFHHSKAEYFQLIEFPNGWRGQRKDGIGAANRASTTIENHEEEKGTTGQEEKGTTRQEKEVGFDAVAAKHAVASTSNRVAQLSIRLRWEKLPSYPQNFPYLQFTPSCLQLNTSYPELSSNQQSGISFLGK